ncbi:MAG TPA: single-stranded DNA-binding protein [Chloroflexota bacterium]|nr:single-stranded DNA-binding protein [Chloroflexota bacterium]
MLNQAVLVGRLVADPELKYTTSGTAVCNVRIAVDRDRPDPGGQKATDFLDVVIWGKTAETVAQHQRKGKLVDITGRIQTRQYETRDGQKRTATEIVADRVHFLSPRDGGNALRQADGSGGAGVGAEDEAPF